MYGTLRFMEIKRSKLEGYKKLTSVPIGKPVGNINLLVLDGFLKPCPIDVTGELYMAGDALAMGYMNDPAKTKQSFIKNIFQTYQHSFNGLYDEIVNLKPIILQYGREQDEANYQAFYLEFYHRKTYRKKDGTITKPI